MHKYNGTFPYQMWEIAKVRSRVLLPFVLLICHVMFGAPTSLSSTFVYFLLHLKLVKTFM